LSNIGPAPNSHALSGGWLSEPGGIPIPAVFSSKHIYFPFLGLVDARFAFFEYFLEVPSTLRLSKKAKANARTPGMLPVGTSAARPAAASVAAASEPSWIWNPAGGGVGGAPYVYGRGVQGHNPREVRQ
jgi:hypothetical protein